jgi:hypothetical protein
VQDDSFKLDARGRDKQQETDMTEQVQITIDRDIYDRLQLLMVPPVNDANAVIKELLFHKGRGSRSAVALEATGQHFTYAQELERSKLGIYDCGGGT